MYFPNTNYYKINIIIVTINYAANKKYTKYSDIFWDLIKKLTISYHVFYHKMETTPWHLPCH